MRSDMFEVIIERPRWGSSYKRKKGRHGEPLRRQEGPTWEPVSLGRGSKGLNENLAPLRRFLESRVGRPWDAVRSEISSILNVRHSGTTTKQTLSRLVFTERSHGCRSRLQQRTDLFRNPRNVDRRTTRDNSSLSDAHANPPEVSVETPPES